MTALPALRQIADCLSAEAERDPCQYVRLTAPQREWLHVRSRFALLRGGNQIGKSTVQAYDLWQFIRGEHPVQTHPPPTQIAVGVYSWAQGDSFIRRIWELRRPGEVHPKIRYVAKQGLMGRKYPVIEVVDGPGRGTVVTFFTYEQGTERIAGETLHRVYLDEPPPERIFGEVVPRLNVRDGHLRLSYTPTPESPPQDWARKMVEAWQGAGSPVPAGDGHLHEVHVPLTVEATTPLGGLIEVPFMPPEKIATFIATLSADERRMRVEGDWDIALDGQWLEHFSHAASVHAFPTFGPGGPPPGSRVAVGVDHGGGPGKQAAVLLAFWDGADPARPTAAPSRDANPAPFVWVMDARLQPGYSTVEQDAAMVLDMLAGAGLSAIDVDLWIGDRASEANRRALAKSNGDLRKELARLARVPADSFWIATPHKFGGSVRRGWQLLNGIMAARWPGQAQAGRSRLMLHPRAELVAKAAQAFRGGKADPNKDILDALRYPVERLVADGHQSRGGAVSRVVGYTATR